MRPVKNRREFLKTVVAAGAATMFAKPAKKLLAASAPAPTLKGKKVLMVWGGWPGHQPRECIPETFKPWAESEGATVSIFRTLDAYLDEEAMSTYDLIIQLWTMGRITREQEAGLLKAVKGGAGMAGWHGGMGDAFRQNTEYQFMTGGQWVAHPGGVIDYSVQIVDHEDPVTAGIPDFDMTSEQYFMHVDPNVKVLATTTFTAEHADWIEGCVMPVAWKKYYGKGRIFYLSIGHQLAHLMRPEPFEIIKRGIRWASESKYHPREEWISPVYLIRQK